MSSHDNDPERARRAYLDAQREIEHDERQKNIYKKAIQEAERDKARRAFLIWVAAAAITLICICVCAIVIIQSMPKTQTPRQPVNNFYYYGTPTTAK